MKESVPKMSGRIYKGERYSFTRYEKRLGKGGNGAVYDVKLEENEVIKFPVVAKFFEYEGPNKEKRYARFRKEIHALQDLNGIEGIIDIIDMKCPEGTPQSKNEAWYLMPKAKVYRVNQKKDIYYKITDMLQLAHIIQNVHKKEGAHRDIKPENILILNDKIVLSDFGLYWNVREDRLTVTNERVGPYKIMPPELENVQDDLEIDFRPADVYLFAKVLWMTLKEDAIGFRGQYQRGDAQIYLNKEKYENVVTLEPIHKLMEEATFDEMRKRISIAKCIEYLELQCKIMIEPKSISKGKIDQLQYEEYSKRVIANNEPDEVSYTDKNIISDMLKGIISLADFYIESIETNQREQIQITDIVAEQRGSCKLLLYIDGNKIKEYLLNIKVMRYSKSNGKIVLELGNDLKVTESYVPYAGSRRGFRNIYSQVYLSSNERIIITCNKEETVSF